MEMFSNDTRHAFSGADLVFKYGTKHFYLVLCAIFMPLDHIIRDI